MVDPTPVTPASTWVPGRKVIASGLAGIVAYFILWGATKAGVQLPVDQTALTGIIIWGVAYLTPPSLRDVLRRLNDDVVKAAQDDTTVNVTKPSMPLASDPQVRR